MGRRSDKGLIRVILTTGGGGAAIIRMVTAMAGAKLFKIGNAEIPPS
jgi:hypothetical protein